MCRLTYLGLLSFVFVFVGCGKKDDAAARKKLKERYDHIEKSARPLLENLKKIEKRVVSIPIQSKPSRFSVPDPLRLKFRSRNLFFVHQEDLLKNTYCKVKPLLDRHQPWVKMRNELGSVKKILESSKGSASYFPLTDAWKRFQPVKYLLVVRGKLVTSKEGRGNTFKPGQFVGDAQLFDVTSGRHIGGIPLRVVSSSKIKVVYRADNKHADISDGFNRDLQKRLLKTIRFSLVAATGKAIAD